MLDKLYLRPLGWLKSFSYIEDGVQCDSIMEPSVYINL